MMDAVRGLVTSEWVLGGIGVMVAVSVFARLCPKEKIVQWLRPPCLGLGRAVSKFLILRLGKKGADRFEEGIIVTVLHALGWSVLWVEEGLIEDNDTKKGGGGDATE